LAHGARRAVQAEAAATLAGGTARSGDIDAAAAFGDVLIWTVRTTEPTAILTDVSKVDGKVVIDLNNRDFANDVRGGAWFETSIAEELQAALPEARVVKAFNTIAMETFDTSPARLRDGGAQSFLAGGDAEAKQIVAMLLHDLGMEAVDLGTGPVAYRAAEALGDVVRLLIIDGGLGGRAHLRLAMLPEPDLETVGERQPSSYR